MSVPATLDSLEMDLTAQVCEKYSYLNKFSNL